MNQALTRSCRMRGDGGLGQVLNQTEADADKACGLHRHAQLAMARARYLASIFA
jgi:hypothetical protein